MENLNFPDERWVVILRVELGEWASIRNFFFFYFALVFRKFARQTKSAIFPRYDKFFYSTLNQQSS